MNHFLPSLLALIMPSILALSPTNQALFEGKKIVILGGTGYLGRALATELLKYNPKHITLFSRDEVKQFNAIKTFGSDKRLIHVIGDIRDYQKLLLVTRKVDIVFHIAALKRIDMLESNVDEVIKTNVDGSLNVFNACITNKVDKVLFVSTDKACLPINAYGACKFISEKLFTNYDKSISTKFMVTRFGNILESTGSIIPIVKEKIKNRELITLTDEQMTRFIINNTQAVELMIDAIRYGHGGEIFIKQLPALYICDLISILKDKANATNQVVTTGLRPGEKLHEVLINSSEIQRTIMFNDLFIIMPSTNNLDKKNVPNYMLEGKYANTVAQEISSDKAIISRAEVENLFTKLNLL